ncbi:MAG: serine/threonine protein kinase [Deltaproteobacteria bacterium]|nr:serine/threonine protein kinase [Deltaproteobacteria bacterium]
MADGNEISSARIATQSMKAGTIIGGRYDIQRVIGFGGMATVYAARDLQGSNRLVALKILHKEYSKDKVTAERFLREIDVLQKIHHPNIVAFYDGGKDGDVVYFAMEYVQGESLQKLQEKKKFRAAEISKLILGICDGLSVIHQLDVIHRDIKPENILITIDGVIKITDFGIARGKNSRLTTKLQKVGSMNYMAPEVWQGKELTAAVDFYALGILLYELVTGKLPYDGDMIYEVMDKHLNEDALAPGDINTSIPAWLDKLIMRLLDKQSSKRPQSAEEIIEYVTANAVDDLMDPGIAKAQTESQIEMSDHAVEDNLTKRRTLTLTLTATMNRESDERIRNKKLTLTIPLPKRAAVIFEIEKPSLDFLFFGIFLISLQVADWYLTSLGVERFTIKAEANPFMRGLMLRFGPEDTLLYVKMIAICFVGFLTIIARRIRWVKNIIAFLSCIYLTAAVLPWIYILFGVKSSN